MKVHSPQSSADNRKPLPPPLWWTVLTVAVVMVSLMALLWPKTKRVAAGPTDSAGGTPPARNHSGASASGATIARRLSAWHAAQPGQSAEQIVADKVRQFGRKRRAIAERIAKRRKEPLPPEIDAFFKAIDKGDWPEIDRLWQELSIHTHQYERSKNDRPDLEPYWPTVLDAYGVAMEQHDLPAQRLLDYGNAIMDSLKPGMVYVGGTDPGRFVPELMSETSEDPHIVITQNALADGSYMEYLGELYGGQLNTLSQDDMSKAFADYTADAQKRYQHDLDFPNEPKQILPGENVSMVDGKFQVTGQVAVMGINDKILQLMMAQNPGVSFALQESFPLRDTYANATPLGPLMELNAPSDQPFTADVAERSVDYWRSATQELLAYPGEGDSAENALKMYAKDVNATANLLAAHNYTSQAEEAYQLALQVYPGMPEAVSGLAQVMAQTGRADQAKALLDQFAAKYPQQRAAIQQAQITITAGAK